MFRPPFELREPLARTTSVIFASPHSGRDYPRAFLNRAQLDEQTIRSSEDAFIDRLVASAPAQGAPLLLAHAPRAYVDLNRAADELDPALIEGLDKGMHNPRVGSGLGVIPRVVAGGRAIYAGKIPRAEAEERLNRVWRPYHECLAGLLAGTRARFGEAILLDIHSMPHEAIAGFSQAGLPAPEVVLGDRFGAAAAPQVVAGVEAAFRRAGLRVARNAPFAGAYVAQYYGRPSQGQHVIQIEIDRALYMDEAAIRPSRRFGAFLACMTGVVAGLATLGRRLPRSLAAE